ncbi:MAG TPA: cupin domain-containing protein [Polyangiaceae bacterium]|nr:cupin domain-containing protein [Polyangiaceae bacterium]
MGRIHSVFKADGSETRRRYSVSEWWLEANTHGPPPHRHDEEHAWFVLEGTMSILVGKTWTRAPQGSFMVIPGGLLHTFENPGRKRAGMLSLNIPGGFEDDMPGIAEWFLANPPGKARGNRAR